MYRSIVPKMLGAVASVLVLSLLASRCVAQEPDPELARPIVCEPIYDGAEVIWVKGALCDVEIALYVDGDEKFADNVPGKRYGSGRGGAMLTLPEPLKEGQVVAAAQVVDGRISGTSVDPVKVEQLTIGEITDPPKGEELSIETPLYHCAHMVKVTDVMNGAMVTVNSRRGDTKRCLTPLDYAYVMIYTPEKGECNYDCAYGVKQELGGHHSPIEPNPFPFKAEEYKGPKNESIPPQPVIEERDVVFGNDTIYLHTLVRGAKVTIYAGPKNDQYNYKAYKPAGEGIACEERFRFTIDSPFQEGFAYRARQQLCSGEKNMSEWSGPVLPTDQLPAPVVCGTLCPGSQYVTVCNTVAGATVKVLDQQTREVLTTFGGNGGCMTVALGSELSEGSTKLNKRTLKPHQVLVAQQSVGSYESPVSAQGVEVRETGTPDYEPDKWVYEPPSWIPFSAYTYALNIRNAGWREDPGDFSDKPVETPTTFDEWRAAAEKDGLVVIGDDMDSLQDCLGCRHVVAMIMDRDKVYWYRRDSNNHWSYTEDGISVTNRYDGSEIDDPKEPHPSASAIFFCVNTSELKKKVGLSP